jgi:hypothetical protein
LGGKHSPIELGKYLSIHQAAMGSLERDGRVLPGGDQLSVQRVERGVLIEGRIRCPGGIAIDVTKVLAVLSGEGDTAIVQTVAYTYHVRIEGLGNLLRYCGPHDDEAHRDHKPFSPAASRRPTNGTNGSTEWGLAVATL